ncbi:MULTISPECIES: hypothetical protein [unclassified Aeribacillus]|jgi:uncharacterized protein (DUF697 family)|uniref:hypothetical protein n=1 Tax=unclassified Aeribacillus TaxID=2640495 RepID=UPI0030D348EE
MLPKTIDQLDQIREECRKLVNRRSSVSAIAAAVPIPGIDVTVDAALVKDLLNEINQKFGLSKEQVDQLDAKTKELIIVLATSLGNELIGRTIGKKLVLSLVKKAATRMAAKQTSKLIPLIGIGVSAGISFATMKYLGNKHIDDCYKLVKQYIEQEASSENFAAK